MLSFRHTNEKAYYRVRCEFVDKVVGDSYIDVKEKMWQVAKNMCKESASGVLLEGEKSSAFGVEQGKAEPVAYFQFLFSVFLNDLIRDRDRA